MIKRKIAIVYDWLDSWGGVERMLIVLNEIFPNADWYTSYADTASEIYKKLVAKEQACTDASIKFKFNLRTSFIQRLPHFIKSNRIFSLLLYPFAFEQFDFSSYDFVISITSSFSKGIITHPNTKHICILLTPTRWLWSQKDRYLKIANFFPGITNCLNSKIANYIKKWDIVASNRPDKIISISKSIAIQCKKYYGRDSDVVYPPFDIKYWSKLIPEQSAKLVFKGKYFLVVSRLEPYKNIDLVIQAFNSLKDKRLIIIGKGRLEARLKRIAMKNTLFIDSVSDQELSYAYSHAQALIMAQEEDFGYTSLEAQYFDCPVIANNKGGASETVINNKTGLLFKKLEVSEIRDAVAEFKRSKYNLDDKQRLFRKFSKEIFIKRMQDLVTD